MACNNSIAQQRLPRLDGGGHPQLDGSRILLPELMERFDSFLHPNDVSCSLRLVNRATAALFRDRQQFTTVRLSQPVPPHAFTWRWGAGGAVRSLTLKQRHRLLRLTAASGSIPNLEVALERVGLMLSFKDWSYLLEAAASAGQVQMCDWLLSQWDFLLDGDTSMAARSAAAAEQRAACELLLTKDAGCFRDLLCGAAHGGHPDLLEWLLLRRPEGPIGPNDSLRPLGVFACCELFADAAEGCNLQMLQRLRQRCFGGREAGGPGDVEHERDWREQFGEEMSCMEAAVRSSTPDWRAKAEWLESLGIEVGDPRWQQRCCVAAAACPDAVARLTWLRQRGYDDVDFEALLERAAEACNMPAMEYLLAEGVAWDPWYGNRLADTGALGALTALHSRGYPLSADVVAWKAAEDGRLPMLGWAVESLGADAQGDRLLARAARSGRVEVMAWVRQRGGSWSGAAMTNVAHSGCEEALEWAAEQGCPMPTDGQPYFRTACNRDVASLRCLKRLGCPWGPIGSVFTRCVDYDLPVPILQWLVQEGCPVDWPAAVAAVRPGRVEIKDWLVLQEQQRMNLCTQQLPSRQAQGLDESGIR